MIHTRKDCRVCNSAALTQVIDLGQHSLHGQFVKPDEPDPPKVTIEVVRCADCGLVQSPHTFSPDQQFVRYFYRSGVNPVMRAHLKQLAEEACEMLPGTIVAPRVLDIAGNDGELLNSIPIATGRRLLIDPSDVPVEHIGISHIRGFFPQDFMLTQQFDLIFTIACLYSVPDPLEFAKAVKKILTKDGMWVIEVADQFEVMRNVAYDFWCSEHVSLFSPYTMTDLLRRAGLKIVRMEPNGCNGGSMRYYAMHQQADALDDHPRAIEWKSQVAALWSHGRQLATDDEAYSLFAQRVNHSRSAIHEIVAAEVAKGNKVHVLGASTKCNVVLQASGLDNSLIEAASDRDPRKVGLVCPGTRIPIISEEESRAKKPKIYFSTLTMFRNELIARERESGSMSDLLFPLPNPHRVALVEGVGRDGIVGSPP